MSYFLDLDSWHRRHHFDFFRAFNQPFFSVCVPVDVTKLHTWTKAEQRSFFLASLYISLRAANAVEPFRYRLRGDQVWVHDTVYATSTVLRENESFGFGYFPYSTNFDTFHTAGRATLDREKRNTGPLELRTTNDDLIHYSVLPWTSFTSFSHARLLSPTNSVPKIVFGKYTQQGNRLMMPVSVEVHHALMDGLHVGRYFEQLASYLAEPQDVLSP